MLKMKSVGKPYEGKPHVRFEEGPRAWMFWVRGLLYTGNWRVKYILQTFYSKIESIFGRTSLIAIKESLKTFNKGKPIESYAHGVSDFEFGDIMSIPV